MSTGRSAPYTLSERMRDECVSEGMAYIDEVAALEAELKDAYKLLDAAKEHALNAVDKLNQGYERAGLSSALVVNNKYGKHSAFGYMGREW